MRTLTDLYVVGKEVTVDDGQGPVTVWLQKLNPIQNERVAEAANMERVKTLTLRKLPKDDIAILVILEEIKQSLPNRIDKIEFVIGKDAADQWQSAESEVAFSDEWSKDNYLEGLRALLDAEDFQRRFRETPSDPEIKRVIDAVSKYNKEVEEAYLKRHRILVNDHEKMIDEELDALCLERMIDANADRRWLIEMRKSEIAYAVRTIEDHKQMYFPDRAAVDEVDYNVLGELIRAYSELTASYSEGKD